MSRFFDGFLQEIAKLAQDDEALDAIVKGKPPGTKRPLAKRTSEGEQREQKEQEAAQSSSAQAGGE